MYVGENYCVLWRFNLIGMLSINNYFLLVMYSRKLYMNNAA